MFTKFFLNMLNREAASPKGKAEEILQAMRLKAGDAVADIGAGGGYFTIAFARLVGETGSVVAVDNNPDHVRFIQQKAKKLGLKNVTPLRTKDDEIPLPKNSIRVIFARSVFHHLEAPEKLFGGLKKALTTDGQVMIIDYIPTRSLNFLKRSQHSTAPERIHAAMQSAGYQLTESYDFLQNQSFTVWSPLEGKN